MPSDDTRSIVASVPFLTPMPRSLRRNMMRSPVANWRSPRSAFTVTSVPRSPDARSRSRALAIEALHLGIGVGEDDPGLVGFGLARTIPTVHQLAPRLLARVGRVDHALAVIGMDRLAGASRRQRARGVALPVLALPPDLGDLGRAVPLGDAAERRAGLDRLQLLEGEALIPR